jgi:hypothetical protein
MMIIGCDFHTRYQQIAMADDQTGELLLERRLEHESGEADAFYRSLQPPVRVGIAGGSPLSRSTLRVSSSVLRIPHVSAGRRCNFRF